MKNRGFTLIELLGILILLGLLSMLVVTNVIEQRDKQKKEVDESVKKILYSDANSYIYDNLSNYKIKAGNNFCISVSDIKTSVDKNKISNHYVKITIDDYEKFIYNLVDDCTQINN